MIVEKEFFIGLSDVVNFNKVSNTTILKFLEDIAGYHSSLVGNGLNDIERTKESWVLLNWKVSLNKRPIYLDTIKIKTWSRKMDKLYAYRDYELYDKDDNLLGIATSKWVLINIETKKIQRLYQELEERYTTEPKDVFGIDTDFGKLKEPESYDLEKDYFITKNLIDVNSHVHNLYYLDIVSEVIPDEVLSKDLNDFEVLYKKEIKKGDTVKCLYKEEEDSYIITIKNENKDTVHSIIKFYK